MYSESPKLQRTRFAGGPAIIKDPEVDAKDTGYREEFMNQLKLVDVSI